MKNGTGEGISCRNSSLQKSKQGVWSCDTVHSCDELAPFLIVFSDNNNNGGFFLLCEEFGRKFNNSFPACAFFYFLVEISSCTLIPLFRPGSFDSGPASWDDCDQVFPDDLSVNSFPDRFPHYAWTVEKSAHSNFVVSKVYACLGVTCHLHFWQNNQGILCATAVTKGRNRHRIRVSTQSWLWRRKFSCRSCLGLNSQPFDYESGTLTNNNNNGDMCIAL